MKVALHFVARDDRPQGIWWESDGTVRSYYVPGSPIEARGRHLVYQKLPDVPWGDYFDQLADCTPVDDDWETVDVAPGMTPREFLEFARSMLGSEAM